MIIKDQSSLINDSKVKTVMSSLEDGQMAFGHIEDDATSAHINKFLDDCLPERKSTAFIRATYSDRTYDRIEIINDNPPPRRLIKETAVTTDALITNSPNIALALPVADCLAMAIYDPVRQVIALAHLGRQASDDDLATKLIHKLVSEFDCNPTNIKAFFSPTIASNCYEIQSTDLKDINKWKDHSTIVDDGIQLDIASYNRQRLIDSGLMASNIELSGINTATDPNYGSHYTHTYRDHAKPKDRFLMAIMLAN